MWLSDALPPMGCAASRRNVILGLATTPLLACGFTPSLAPGGSADALRNQVLLDEPRDPEEFVLFSALEDRLGQPVNPVYALSYLLNVRETNAGITPDNVITRGVLTGRAEFLLTDRATGLTLTAGEVTTFTSYGTTGTTAETTFARDDAFRRLTQILADELIARLLASSPDWLA
ncbi:MAG: hypothetical protein AAGF74_05770 [Pseudomonadota bacterium]